MVELQKKKGAILHTARVRSIVEQRYAQRSTVVPSTAFFVVLDTATMACTNVVKDVVLPSVVNALFNRYTKVGLIGKVLCSMIV